jgi:hypothetical protein
MLNWLADRNVAAWAVPWNVTVEAATKPVPLMRTVSGLAPATAEDGDRVVMAGTGFGVVTDATTKTRGFDAVAV